MLQLDVEIVTRKQMNLVGYSVGASLNDDVLGAIVVGLRDKLASRVAEVPHSVDRSMMLVQVYPDWMIAHVVPEGRFLRFLHQGDESRIDATHVAINEWLDLHGYTDAREFDIERWATPENLKNANNIIEIYIPIAKR
ncbi:GyrI-like domain-containing protein [Paenibacillus sp. PAMC21692]|uniref:GyrI-like domain-containing protein n=1 Tax=Paenibacillus sp. PAMC21692 TaxID=2762320 RepID=UPI00164E1277|nr:GyrI-like domain-containing protein [Paenibacillus sp. PAMC21692]QNK56938.1 GyrI-like domain-containing protein [Paenibacillus sp. PAMC21692]